MRTIDIDMLFAEICKKTSSFEAIDILSLAGLNLEGCTVKDVSIVVEGTGLNSQDSEDIIAQSLQEVLVEMKIILSDGIVRK